MDRFPAKFRDKFDVLEGLQSRRGTVVKAQERALGRVVAVKFFSPGLFEGAEAVERFLEEARLLAKLKHANIVEVYDVEADPECPFMVMEFIDGFSLKDEIARMGKIPLRHACNYMLQMAEGLGFVHKQGLVHRNLKPKNTFIDRFSVLKILDFGFALPTGGSAVDGGKGRVLGTPAYMSPEQATGSKLDNRTDVYSAGVIFFEMLCGRPPFTGETPKDIMKAHVHDVPPSIRDFNPRVPGDVRAIVNRMLAKDFAERYDTMDKVVRDLKRFMSKDDWETADQGAVDPHPTIGVRRRGRRSRRGGRQSLASVVRRSLLYVFLLALAVAAGAFGDRLWRAGARAVGLEERPRDVSLRLRGRLAEVRWRTDRPLASRLRLRYPATGRFCEGVAGGPSTEHLVRIRDLPDAPQVRLEILMQDDLPSEELVLTAEREPVVSLLKADAGITEVTFAVETVPETRLAVEVREKVAGSLAARTFAAEAPSPGRVHHLTVHGLPAATSYEAVVVARWDESAGAPGARVETLWDEQRVLFRTGEPSYRSIFKTPQGDVIRGEPLVVDDRVVVGADDGTLYCVAAREGRLLWSAAVGGAVKGPLALVERRVAAVGRGGRVVAVDVADGKLAWEYPCGAAVEGGLSAGGGALVVASVDGAVHRLRAADGHRLWKADLGRPVESTPLGAEGAVYVGDQGGSFMALSADTGRRLWAFQTGNRIAARAEVCDRMVLVPGMDDTLYSLLADRGVTSWRKVLGSFPGGLVVATAVGTGAEDLLYASAVGSQGSRLLCANARTGATVWTADLPAAAEGRPALSEGRAYVGGIDGVLYCFDASSGIRLWSVATGAEIRGGPAAAGGAVYVANWHGDLFRVED